MFLPLSHWEQSTSTKKTPTTPSLPTSGTLGPVSRASLVVCLLTSLTDTEVKPQTTGPNITSSLSLTALSEQFALFCHHLPTLSKVRLGIIIICFPEGKDLFSFTT